VRSADASWRAADSAQLCRRRPGSTGLTKRGSVPLRDETGRFIGVRPKTAAERAQKALTGSGGIFKGAAVQVLRAEKRLMSTGARPVDAACKRASRARHAAPAQRTESHARVSNKGQMSNYACQKGPILSYLSQCFWGAHRPSTVS
jgi:hypothetical protein